MSNTTSPARGIGSAIDLGVAALAGGSVAFLAFAMPEDVFSSLINATHLPDLVAAAAPPLGMKARYAVMGAGALITFLAVWSLMRALDRLPVASAAKPGAEADAPRVRRADSHPDAPARRPLLAGADLGEPETDIYELERPVPAPPARTEFDTPDRHVPPPQPPVYDIPAPVLDTGPVYSAEPGEISERKLPRFLVNEEGAAEPERNPIVPPARKRPFEALASRLPQTSAGGDESIDSLMQRLEKGLGDREEPAGAAEPDLPPVLHAASENPEASLSPEGVRHRLRSAISDLNQQANRG
jgi:hypothetical protein